MKLLMTIMCLLCSEFIFAQLSTPDLKFSLNIFANRKISWIKENAAGEIQLKQKFLIIHGDVSYDFFYRSKLDTPVFQNDFRQHTEKVNLKILVKDRYPLQLSFALRQSNSFYFNNFCDLNFQFDKNEFQKNYKQNLLNNVIKSIVNKVDLKSLEDKILEKEKDFEFTNNWLKNPITLQKIIEERETEFAESKLKDNKLETSLNGLNKGQQQQFVFQNKLDSTRLSIEKVYQQKAKKLDSLKNEIISLRHKADSLKTSIQRKIVDARKLVSKARSQDELLKLGFENGIQADTKKKFEKFLMSIKRMNIGRSMVNYTELTAQNIMLTGINVEYNPSYYTAFVAGKINYRFRDFYNRKAKANDQYLLMGRIGIGNPEKKALILSVFQGRKSLSSGFFTDSATNQVTVVGYSIESIFKKDENTSISIEAAKSTKPVVGNLQTNKQIATLWKLSDQSNFGVNIKAQTFIPETNTRLSGFFRKTGKDFQSFSLFSYNSDQVAWLAKIDQSILHERIELTGMLRRNDFTNPFTEKTFKTSTIFKSIMLNVRWPKLPFFNIGYYPGSQLYLVDKDVVRESVYYMLNGSLTYGYFYKRHAMTSSIVYNKYINQASDSGFVFYKGINYYLSQTIALNKLQLQGGYSYSERPELKYYTLESFGDYSFKKMIVIGVGCKYNKTTANESYWGWRLQSSLDLKTLGFLRFQYEKSFLPTINQTLFPVVTGRIFWFKYF